MKTFLKYIYLFNKINQPVRSSCGRISGKIYRAKRNSSEETHQEIISDFSLNTTPGHQFGFREFFL